MADKKIDAGAIQIEDPLDFLSPAEKKEYIRAHQDTLLRSDEDLQKIREATESVTEPEEAYEGENIVGHEEEVYEEDAYEEDAYDGDADEEDDYEEALPERKPYVYQDTRLHTDERRSRAVKAAKPAKEEKAEKTKRPAPQPARQRAAYAAEAANAYEDDEVEETAFDYMLSAVVKAFLAAIIIVVLIMAYMLYVRPLIRRATGLSGQATQEATEDTIGMDEVNTGTQSAGRNAEAPEGSETVVTTTQLNLRTAPNTETSEVVTSVPEGSSLTRLSDDGEWSKVLFNGQELYCASAYLKQE